jgi:hypothetical protein
MIRKLPVAVPVSVSLSVSWSESDDWSVFDVVDCSEESSGVSVDVGDLEQKDTNNTRKKIVSKNPIFLISLVSFSS